MGASSRIWRGWAGPGARLAGRGLEDGLPTPERLAGLPDYTRRTRTRSPLAANPPGACRKAPRSSGPRSRSSWATIGASVSDERAHRPRGRPGGTHPWRPGRAPPTRASQVVVARARRSSASRPSARAAAGRRSPIRSIGRRRRTGHRTPAIVPGPTERRAIRPGLDGPAGAGGAEGRVEVVERRRRHERLGQVGDPTDEMGPPLRVELAEDVVEQEQRRASVDVGQQVELGELEGEDRRPLLAARGEAGQVATLQLEHEVVAMGPDQRGPVPDLLLGRLGQAPGQRVPRATHPAAHGAFVS